MCRAMFQSMFTLVLQSGVSVLIRHTDHIDNSSTVRLAEFIAPTDHRRVIS